MVKKTFNSLIVGFGSIGNRHSKNLKSLGYENIDVFRTFKNKTKYPKINNINILKNYDEALRKKKYDLIILANPTSKHINYAIKGAKNGANIYIEKPLSNSLKNTKLLQTIEKKKKN